VREQNEKKRKERGREAGWREREREIERKNIRRSGDGKGALHFYTHENYKCGSILLYTRARHRHKLQAKMKGYYIPASIPT
jgi:hypothetical protein